MGYDRLTDETLIDLIGRRDAAALEALYDRYARQAYTVAQIVAREPDAAAAVVEELFWTLWQRGAAPSPGSEVRNSLMLSARRLAERAAQPQL
jgi:DNA-directed RNA polymerase specialized sigma24 family protein